MQPGSRPPSSTSISPAVDSLLDLARIAAHDSGDRRNAPLLCYLVGKAERGIDLESLATAIRRVG
jgi:hypothetical protein